MPESTIKRKWWQLKTDGYLPRKEESGKNRLIDEEKTKLYTRSDEEKCFLTWSKYC